MEKNSQELIATSTLQTLLLNEQTSVQGQSFTYTYVVIVILMSNTLEIQHQDHEKVVGNTINDLDSHSLTRLQVQWPVDCYDDWPADDSSCCSSE